MTDPLDALQKALQDTPAPSDKGRDAALRAAMQGFEEEFQGSEAEARPTPERPHPVVAFWKGLKSMARKSLTRPALLGTASIATLMIAVVVTQDQGGDVASLGEQMNAKATPPAPLESLSETENDRLALENTAEQSEAQQRLASSTEARGAMVPPSEEIQADAELSPRVGDIVGGDASPGSAELGATHADKDESGEPEFTDSYTLGVELQPSVQAEESAGAPSANQINPGNSTAFAEEQTIVAPEPEALSAPQETARRERQISQGMLSTGMFGGGGGLPSQSPTPNRPVPSATAPQLQPEADLIEISPVAEPSGETFPDAPQSDIKSTSTDPVSTFSIDVDTASYSYVRSALTGGTLPDPGAIRIEEMINYFNYSYPKPASREVPFTTSISVSETPWDPGTQILQIGLQGYEIAAEDRPPLNLVFLIDTSGSMNDANKLPLLISAFSLLLTELQPEDEIAIVTYAGSAGMALPPTPASERAKILQSLQALRSGGSTAGAAGLQQAYQLAESMGAEGETTRVILATDGDFNVGISNPEELKKFVEEKRKTGTYLSVLGFGRGNYNDALMQALAQNGNGIAAYIDTLSEAQKVLIDDMTGSLFPIAGDVKIQVEFNPAEIAEYRLIGYETRALRREDFNNDAVDAGEIGAGHSVTALYEITPVGSPSVRIDPLRYGAEAPVAVAEPTDELAFVKLRYKQPGEAQSQLISTPVLAGSDGISLEDQRFAVAVAGFGEALRSNPELGSWSFSDAEALAATAIGEDPFGYRAEFLRLARLAKALSGE